MRRHSQQGLSLIELMISVALGFVILLGLLTLFDQNGRNFRQNEASAEMQDSARVALEALSRDLSMAGYIGGIFDPTALVNDPGGLGAVTPDCGPGNNSTGLTTPWFSQAQARIEFIDIDTSTAATVLSTFGCLGQATTPVQASTDVIAVRHAAGVPAFDVKPNGTTTGALAPSSYYLVSNGTSGSLSKTTPAGTPTTTALPSAPPRSFYLWQPRLYFVRTYSTSPTELPLVPTLCRMELQQVASASMAVECLADGVEDLQIEWGIGGNLPTSCTPTNYMTNPTAAQLSSAVTARIWLLVRAARPEAGYTDSKTYTMGSNNPASANHVHTLTTADQQYRRRLYTTTVKLRNQVGNGAFCQ